MTFLALEESLGNSEAIGEKDEGSEGILSLSSKPLSTLMKKGVTESLEPNMAFQTTSGRNEICAMTNSKGYVHMSSRPTCIIFVYVVYLYIYKHIHIIFVYTCRGVKASPIKALQMGDEDIWDICVQVCTGNKTLATFRYTSWFKRDPYNGLYYNPI